MILYPISCSLKENALPFTIFPIIQIILLPQHFEFSLHLDDEFVFQFFEFYFEFLSLFFVFVSKIIALLVGVLLHQSVDSLPLSYFELTQLLPEI